MFNHPLALIDILSTSLAIGAMVWFFFIQSPALIKIMGRGQFVPIQMRLTKLLFKMLMYATLLVLVLALLLNANPGGQVLSGAMIAAAGGLISHFYVIPKALRAGGKGRIEAKKANTEGSVAKFAVEGSGPSSSFWHQTVVAFVVMILVGLIVHVNGVLGLG